MITAPKAVARVKDAIIRVGGGRGFVVATRRGKLVITAAHCLPRIPPAHPSSYTKDRTYDRLLGPIGESPSVWSECLFVDPVADVAVLCEPDSQVLCDEWEAYDALVKERPTIRISRVTAPRSGWLLAKSGEWQRCTLTPHSGEFRSDLGVKDFGSQDAIALGTSGSPILTGNGHAVGVMSTGEDRNPILADALPAKLLRALAKHRVERLRQIWTSR